MRERVPRDLLDDEHEHDDDGGGRERFVFPVPVRVIEVGRLAGSAYADERNDVRRRVGERVKAVGDDTDSGGRVSEDQFCEANSEIGAENGDENPADLSVAILQNSLALGNGHQRSCTLPMMYFFGTSPQWRLSELLFRWSPMTK